MAKGKIYYKPSGTTVHFFSTLPFNNQGELFLGKEWHNIQKNTNVSGKLTFTRKKAFFGVVYT